MNSLSDRIWERCTGFAWDEAHLFYSQKSPHFIAQSANLLRLQMNQRKLPFILLGTDIVDLYVQSPELNNRFRPRAELTRFTIDTDTNEQEFRDQLTALESAAPLTFIPSLSERRMVYRTFCACDGLTGYLMDIMERAINRALRANQTIIELDDLEKAFADEFSERASVFNPFSEHTDDELIREIAKRALNLKAIGAASRKQGRQK